MVVLNNGTLGFVELEMKAGRFLDEGTEQRNPNFADMANAVGVHGIRVEDPGDLTAAVVEALAHDGPVLVNVVTNRMVLAMPPRTTMEQAKGSGSILRRRSCITAATRSRNWRRRTSGDEWWRCLCSAPRSEAVAMIRQ